MEFRAGDTSTNRRHLIACLTATQPVGVQELPTGDVTAYSFVDRKSKSHSLNFSLRHEVARLIVWQVIRTRPVVPSAVSYADVRKGNDPYRACGHGTHSHPTGTGTARERCICQHQAEMGLDEGYSEHL